MKPRNFGTSTHILGLDTEQILQTLSAYSVDYVVVGGLAAIAHGSTMATADADVLPRPDQENLERLLDALEALDAKILASEERLSMEAGPPWEAQELNSRGPQALESAAAWHFTTSAGPIDVVMSVTGVGPYEAHIDAAEEREVFGLRVKVAGVNELIASKEAVGRTKDEVVLRELRELRGEGGLPPTEP